MCKAPLQESHVGLSQRKPQRMPQDWHGYTH